MRTKNDDTKKELTAGQQLAAVLADVDDPKLQSEISLAFELNNPLDFARLLNARPIATRTKGDLMRLKVEQPPKYEPNLGPLLEEAGRRHFETLLANITAINEVEETPNVL